MISHREKEVVMGSLDKAMSILKHLGDPPYEFSLSELASFVDIGKSGAFKILKTLQAHNFVIQDFLNDIWLTVGIFVCQVAADFPVLFYLLDKLTVLRKYD